MDTEDTIGGLSCAQTCFNDKDYNEVVQLIQQIQVVAISDNHINIQAERILERYTYILDLYLEQPHLLDPKIPEMISKLLKLTDYKNISQIDGSSVSPVGILSFKFLWHLCKVRRVKCMSKFLPHEVMDFMPVLSLLENETLDLEAACFLLLWLKLLCKIPFDLSRLDAEIVGKSRIIDRLLIIGKRYLQMSNKCCELSAHLLCELITRPDVKGLHLESEIMDCIDSIGSLDLSIHADQVKAIGKCTLLASVFKHANRDDLTHIGKVLLNKLQKTELFSASEIVLRKLSCKLVQRIGQVYLPEKISPWRYERGLRALAQNLDQACTPLKMDASVALEEVDYFISDEVEIVVQLLLNWLTDKDTVVRWSAAKGIGRVTARLPMELADEVMNSVLESFSASMCDSAWHGGCLAIAELARKGLILPHKLASVIKVVVVALTYDKQVGRHSVGKHVRDAACYVCWAFARAFQPNIITPFINELAVNLLTVALFDREVNCRRAASAAFQENVGRQGNLPHGIEIVTIADYFSVGNRIHCYHSISVQVAKYEEYREKFIDHLLQFKIGHWDLAIRQLACGCLGRLCDVCPSACDSVMDLLIRKTTDNDIFMRQGALFAVGDVYSAFARNNLTMETSVMEKIAMIPCKTQPYFKNLGGEMTRIGVNYLIEKLAAAKFPILTVKSEQINTWLGIIRDGLRNEDVHIRNGTALCVEPFTSYLINDKSPISAHDFFHESFKRIRSVQERDCIGGILSIGHSCMPLLNEGCVDSVLDILCTYTVCTANHDTLWAEARREAVLALDRLVRELMPLSCALFTRLINVYVTAMHDYTLDSRGDIGRIVRMAAIQGLQNIIILTLESEKTDLLSDRKILDNVMDTILQQCCEKIDSVREIACNAITSFVTPKRRENGEKIDATFVDFLNLDQNTNKILRDVFTECDHVKWLSGKEAFHRLAPLLKSKYQKSVLMGFIVSGGCITESTRKSASDALLDYVKEMREDPTVLRTILDTIALIFEENQSLDRVVTPLLACLDILLSSGYFEVFYENADQIQSLEIILKLTLLATARKRSPLKVVSGLTICSCMMQFQSTSKVYLLAIKQLVRSLSHPFPTVRKEAANQLYGSLLTYGSLDNHSEQCLSLLTQSKWDSEDLDGLRGIRDQIKDLLIIE